ncbi:2,3-diphosphoglycerate-dependent phosphoglycerate mutase [Aciditerrimonas ferrireducens]|uniref:2,3-bisphosphoglycerate-dependent phosphoglycerate mutase n=1 Tax=Aciditerrimonas ferrireducens TaxID=667306 RepID=A0ABV6BYM7_9ACTN
MSHLVLLRHGQSVWNAENRFTGWTDVDLSPVGEDEARQAGRLLREEQEAGQLDLVGVHTSLLTRAVRTATLALETMGRPWLPVRRSWRLNERHYGDLQGRNKAETAERHGLEQVQRWRRSYDEPPPPLDPSDPRSGTQDPRYRGLPASALPRSECLADVVRRVVPWFEDCLAADLAHGDVLVVAHGNSIRALAKHLKGISDEAIVDLEVPTGVPWVLRFGPDLTLEEDRFLGDPATVAALQEAVRRQAGG